MAQRCPAKIEIGHEQRRFCRTGATTHGHRCGSGRTDSGNPHFDPSSIRKEDPLRCTHASICPAFLLGDPRFRRSHGQSRDMRVAQV
jgi:hypothetical protein